MNKKLNKKEIIKKIESQKEELKKRGVKKLGLFGSYAKGKENKKSDIDFLVEVKSKLTLSDLSKIQIFLEKNFKKKVDLIEYQCIHPFIRKQALTEEIKII
jgi:uncharacterized protein